MSDEHSRDTCILVVEDEDGVRTLITRLLMRAGYDVSAASNGNDALAMLGGERRFDLVVTDIVMPGMKGTEMVQQIRETHPHMPILYVTGYPQEDDFTLNHRERVLFKPFNQKDLVGEVKKCLEEQNQP